MSDAREVDSEWPRVIDELAKAFSLAAGWTWHDVANDDPGPRAREAAQRIRESLRSAGISIVDSIAEEETLSPFVLLGDKAYDRALALELSFDYMKWLNEYAALLADKMDLIPNDDLFMVDTKRGVDIWIRLADYIVEGR